MLKKFFDVMALKRKINTMQNEIDTIKEEDKHKDIIIKRTKTMLKKERAKRENEDRQEK